jgi:hypothetical protein
MKAIFFFFFFYFFFFSTQFSSHLCEVILKYFGGNLRICINFICCRKSLDFLEVRFRSLLSSY